MSWETTKKELFCVDEIAVVRFKILLSENVFVFFSSTVLVSRSRILIKIGEHKVFTMESFVDLNSENDEELIFLCDLYSQLLR